MKDKIAIIGDIHGCPKTFRNLLSKLPDSIEQIYTVGDLIDRGPNSKEVIQICIDNNISSARGNHEDMFIDYIFDTKVYDNGIFIENGGNKTVASYGGSSFKIKSMYGSEWVTNPIDIPDEHLEYLKNMSIYIETDELLISHAGVHHIYNGDHGYGIYSDLENERVITSMLWNRNSIAKIKNKIQIFGHTPHYSVKFIDKWNTLTEENELIGINLDTGCGKDPSYKLSSVLWPSKKIIQVENIDL